MKDREPSTAYRRHTRARIYGDIPGILHDPSQPNIEAVERDAIQREAELAVPQRIPQATMLRGLLKVARWR